MTSGFITDTGLYKIGGAFFVYKTKIIGETDTYGWYSYELAGWVSDDDVSGSSDNVKAVNGGASFYSDSDLTTELGEVSDELNFVSVAVSSSDGGTCSASSLYGGRYAIVGTTVVFTVAANTGFKELSFTINGASSTKSILVGQLDIVAIVTFCPTSYSVENSGVVGSGSAAVSVGGTPVLEGHPVAAERGSTISVLATPSAGNVFSYAEIDGRRIASNPAAFSIVDRVGSPSVPVRTVFVAIAVIRDTIVTNGSGSVSVKKDGELVPLQDGSFTATIGSIYTVTATPNSGYRVDGFYENGRKVAAGTSYVFVQDEANRVITVAFVEAETISVYLFSGGDITSSVEEWNGCTCSVVRPSGTGIGTYTFTPSAADGYHFVRLYIEDTDGTGKGRVIPAGQSLAVSIDFNARVVAIFAADDAPDEPDDEDQGNATHTTAILNEWEGSETRMVARWRSRRNVFTKPVSMSAARICANGYGSNGPIITIAAYESPNVKDGMEVSIPVDNQDAFRLPKERPEKYVEVEVASDSRVLELAASTSMEGLWQASS